MILKTIYNALDYAKKTKAITTHQYEIYKETLKNLTYEQLFMTVENNNFETVYNIIQLTNNYVSNISTFAAAIACVMTFLHLIPASYIYHLILAIISMPFLYIFIEWNNFDTKKELRKYLYYNGKVSLTDELLQKNDTLSPVEKELQEIYEKLNSLKQTEQTESLKNDLLSLYYLLQDKKDEQALLDEQVEIEKIQSDLKGVKNYIQYKTGTGDRMTNNDTKLSDTMLSDNSDNSDITDISDIKILKKDSDKQNIIDITDLELPNSQKNANETLISKQ